MIAMGHRFEYTGSPILSTAAAASTSLLSLSLFYARLSKAVPLQRLPNSTASTYKAAAHSHNVPSIILDASTSSLHSITWTEFEPVVGDPRRHVI